MGPSPLPAPTALPVPPPPFDPIDPSKSSSPSRPKPSRSKSQTTVTPARLDLDAADESRMQRIRARRKDSAGEPTTPTASIPERTSSTSSQSRGSEASSGSSPMASGRRSLEQVSSARDPPAPIRPARPPASQAPPPRKRSAMKTYEAGAEWIISAVRPVGYKEKDKDDVGSPKWTFGVSVTRDSVRADGNWAREADYTVWRKWEEFVSLRESLVSRFPQVDIQLPKFTKPGLFSKSSRSTQAARYKELESFLAVLFRLSHAITDSSAVRDVFDRDVPIDRPEYVEGFSPLSAVLPPLGASTSRDAYQSREGPRRGSDKSWPTGQVLGYGDVDRSADLVRPALSKKRSEPLLNLGSSATSPGLAEAATIRPATTRRTTDVRDVLNPKSEPGLRSPEHVTGRFGDMYATQPLPRLRETEPRLREVEPLSIRKTSGPARPTQHAPSSSLDLDRSQPSRPPARPSLRSYKSLSDVRGQASRPAPQTAPPPVPSSLPIRHQPLPALTDPSVILRPGRHAIVSPPGSATTPEARYRRHRRGQGSSSGSSGSGSVGSHHEAASALGLSLHGSGGGRDAIHGQTRSIDSADSLVFSDSSMASPGVPPTPPSANTGGSGPGLGGGKYIYDDQVGLYVPSSSTPSSFLSIHEPSEILSVTTASAPMSYSRSADVIPKRQPGGYPAPSHGTSPSGGFGHRRRTSSTSQAPRLETILASPNVDSGGFANEPSVASLSLRAFPPRPSPPRSTPTPTQSAPSPVGTGSPTALTVKVLHAESTNIVVKVPGDVSLSRLRAKIAHKFAEGAGVSLSRDGEYEWGLEVVSKADDGPGVGGETGAGGERGRAMRLGDERAWRRASDGLSRLVLRVV